MAKKKSKKKARRKKNKVRKKRNKVRRKKLDRDLKNEEVIYKTKSEWVKKSLINKSG